MQDFNTKKQNLASEIMMWLTQRHPTFIQGKSVKKTHAFQNQQKLFEYLTHYIKKIFNLVLWRNG